MTDQTTPSALVNPKTVYVNRFNLAHHLKVANAPVAMLCTDFVADETVGLTKRFCNAGEQVSQEERGKTPITLFVTTDPIMPMNYGLQGPGIIVFAADRSITKKVLYVGTSESIENEKMLTAIRSSLVRGAKPCGLSPAAGSGV